jgi:hypothetical protein
MICKICSYESSGKDFSNHLKKEHKLSSKEYTAKYIYSNNIGCKNCGKETRYVAFQFKKYCSDCSKVAMSEGGRRGGRHEAWNKGKTSKEDSRIKGQKGKDNPFWGKKHSEETINRISFTKRLGDKKVLERILQRSEEFEILTPLEEYFSRQRQYLEFKCKKCDFVCKKTLQAFERGSLCPKCYPISRSKSEIEVYDFVKTLVGESVKSNDRTLIKPKEIDIYVADKHFGIEYNGLYWHSDLVDRTSKNELKNKTEKVLEQNTKLMHIFSDEWDFKKDICKSMIRSRLGLCVRIWARKCAVRELETKVFNDFMNECHISGKVNSSIKLGLFYNDKLVSAIGFRKPRQRKWKGYWEISRFSSQLNTNVVGGLSKLLKYFKTNYEGSIMTYADRRFGEGLGYEKVGFQYVGNTGVDYWYSDGVQRFDRFMFKTDKNEKEIEKVTKLKLFKVWGCGSNIWVWD